MEMLQLSAAEGSTTMLHSFMSNFSRNELTKMRLKLTLTTVSALSRSTKFSTTRATRFWKPKSTNRAVRCAAPSALSTMPHCFSEDADERWRS